MHPTRELTPEEMAALKHDMEEVLKKHNAEMSVISSIHLMKYVDEGPSDSATAEKTPEANASDGSNSPSASA